MFSQQNALQLLDRYLPEDSNELEAKRIIRDFIDSHPRFWSRSTPAGHLTASAWITNQQQTKAILLHHKKLNIWVQPGGHIDDSDASLAMASLREATEETGIESLQFKSAGIFDLDVHTIPERRNEPAHLHFDVRFWFVAVSGDLLLSEESHALAWLTRSDIEDVTQEESILRMVRKTI